LKAPSEDELKKLVIEKRKLIKEMAMDMWSAQCRLAEIKDIK
jgi:hypothetical protein